MMSPESYLLEEEEGSSWPWNKVDIDRDVPHKPSTDKRRYARVATEFEEEDKEERKEEETSLLDCWNGEHAGDDDDFLRKWTVASTKLQSKYRFGRLVSRGGEPCIC